MRSIGKRNQWGTINKLGVSATMFLGAFFVAFMISASLAPAQDSSAAEISVTSDASGYFASISTLGTIGTDLYPSYNGNAKITKDTVTVTTNAKNGYKLYIGTPSTAPGTALYNESDETKTIPASAGTLASPVKLAKDTWGYVAARETSSATAQTYTDANINETSGQAIIRGVPAYGSENVLYTNTSPMDSATNSLDVYYGVNVSSATRPGVYSNSVAYTAIVDAVNAESEQASIAPASQEGLAAGTSVTISTGLYPGFNAANIGEITVTIGGNACTDVTPSVTAAGNLNVTCTAPAASAAGKKDVVVNVAKYSKTYTLTEGYEYVSTLPDFYTISTMQEMTSSVCNSVPTPSAAATTSMTAANYDKDLLVANGSYVAETTLSDIRDSNSYTVRKLADGNCWMRQNLTLDLPSGQTERTLTSGDTDLNTKTSWILEDWSDTAGKMGWCNTDSPTCDDQKLISRTGYSNGGTAPTYYYNWYTATAGAGSYSVSSGDTTDSICPKGWKLPTKAQFVALDQAYGGSGSNRMDADQITNFINNVGFGITGFRNAATVYDTTSNALYWSRSASSAVYAHVLHFYPGNSNFYPQLYDRKWYGFAARCLSASS